MSGPLGGGLQNPAAVCLTCQRPVAAHTVDQADECWLQWNRRDPHMHPMTLRECMEAEEPSAQMAAPGASRRERIATRALQGLLANPAYFADYSKFASDAVRHADELIDELDKQGNKHGKEGQKVVYDHPATSTLKR